LGLPTATQLKLFELRVCAQGKAWHVLRRLDDDHPEGEGRLTTIADTAFREGMHVLAVTAAEETAHGPCRAGPGSEPIAIKLQALLVVNGSAEAEAHEIFLCKDATLEELQAKIASLVGYSEEEQVLHLLPSGRRRRGGPERLGAGLGGPAGGAIIGGVAKAMPVVDKGIEVRVLGLEDGVELFVERTPKEKTKESDKQQDQAANEENAAAGEETPDEEKAAASEEDKVSSKSTCDKVSSWAERVVVQETSSLVSSLAQQFYEHRKEKVRLVVTSSTSLDSSSVPFDVMVPRSFDLRSVKEMLAKAVGFIPEDASEQERERLLGLLRMRRSVKTKDLGNIMYDESLDVRAADLDDGATIILEEEPLPGRDEVMLNFYHLTAGWDYDGASEGSSQAGSLHEVFVKADGSILECKRQMLKVLNEEDERFIDMPMDAPSVRLRYCVNNSRGERQPGKLFANEDVTVAKEKLKHGDVLVVEDGRPPIKGQIIVKVSVLLPVLTAAHTPKDEEAQDEAQDEVEETPSSAVGEEEADKLEFIGEIVTGERLTMLKFKQLLVELPEFSAKTLGHANQDPRRLRLQHLEGDFSLGQVYRDHTASLKALEVHDGMSLAVKVLSGPEDLSSNSVVLRVQRRLPNEFNYEAPREVVIDAGGQALSSTILAEQLGLVYGIEPKNALVAVRREVADSAWKVLRREAPTSKKKGSKKKANGGITEQVIPNLMRPPWDLRDMCLVGVKDISLEVDPTEVENFLSTADLDAGLERVTKKPGGKWKENTEEVALSMTMMSMREN